MDWELLYRSPEWANVRDLALARDADVCTVARLLGGDCSPVLHVHHLDRNPELALDVDNLGTACARHHPKWEAVRRAVVERRDVALPPCRHVHRYDHARRECLRTLRHSARMVVSDDPPEQVTEPQLDAALLVEERDRALWQAFGGLSERCQGLLRLLVADPPPSYEEVSIALRVSALPGDWTAALRARRFCSSWPRWPV